MPQSAPRHRAGRCKTIPPTLADITVTLPDGNAVTVAPDALTLPEGTGLYGGDFGAPEGFTPSDRFENELARRVEGKLSKGGYLTPEEAYAPDALKKQFQRLGIEVDEDLKPVAKLTAEQRDSIASLIREDEVAPLQQQLADISSKYEAVQAEKLRFELRNALTGELAEDVFKPLAPGVPSQFDSIVASLVTRDDDGSPVFMGEGGIPDRKVAEALLKHIGKHAKHLLADKRQRGGGLDGSRGSGDGKTMQRAHFESLSPDAQMKFITGGGQLID